MEWLKGVWDNFLKLFGKELEKNLPPATTPPVQAAPKPAPLPVTPKPPLPPVVGDDDTDRPDAGRSGQKLLWCPLATIVKPEMKAAGTYRKGYPEGAIVHFTAGRDKSEADAKGSLSYGREQGYMFFVIGPDGTIYQSFPLNKWGSHAGSSFWPDLGSSVSRYLVGIEVANAGRLEKSGTSYKSWFGAIYPAAMVRVVKAQANQHAGAYKKMTDAQEESLKELLLWLKHNNPEVFDFKHVLGHDEVAPSRKNDPGGALSMTMPEYRKMLEKEYAKYSK